MTQDEVLTEMVERLNRKGKRPRKPFKVGQWCLVYQETKSKAEVPFRGPFRVVEVKSPTVYRVFSESLGERKNVSLTNMAEYPSELAESDEEGESVPPRRKRRRKRGGRTTSRGLAPEIGLERKAEPVESRSTGDASEVSSGLAPRGREPFYPSLEAQRGTLKKKILAVQEEGEPTKFWLARVLKETTENVEVWWLGTKVEVLSSAVFKNVWQRNNRVWLCNKKPKKAKCRKWLGWIPFDVERGYVLSTEIQLTKSGGLTARSKQILEALARKRGKALYPVTMPLSDQSLR